MWNFEDKIQTNDIAEICELLKTYKGQWIALVERDDTYCFDLTNDCFETKGEDVCWLLCPEECDGFCYTGHTYRKIKVGSRRKFGVLVGVIAYNVYKDAFLDEILETVKENEKPITKAQFRSIQGFSR